MYRLKTTPVYYYLQICGSAGVWLPRLGLAELCRMAHLCSMWFLVPQQVSPGWSFEVGFLFPLPSSLP